MRPNYVTIQDQIGRTVIGVLSDETDSTLTIQNPVILHLELEQNGSIQVQTYPVFFFELLAKDARDTNLWVYNKNSIVRGQVTLSESIISQYERINNPPAPVAPSNKVISINDL